MPIEPLSIAVACTSLISNVGKATSEIYSFVSKVRDAHRDLDAVLKELSSLGLCLETLRNDAMVTSKRVPQPLEHRVLLVLVNTAEVVKEMREMLDNLSSDRFGNQMKWAIYGQNDMNKLRNRLESHKASLEIALALLTLSLTTAIKDDTSSIRRNVKETAFGLDQIAQVLAALPERVAAQLQVGALNEAAIVDTIRPALQMPAPEAPVATSARKLESLFPPMNSKDQTPSNLDAVAVHSSREMAVVAAESVPGQPINSTLDHSSQSRRYRVHYSREVMHDRQMKDQELAGGLRDHKPESRFKPLRENEVVEWERPLPDEDDADDEDDEDDDDNRHAPGFFESIRRKPESGASQVERHEERLRLPKDDKENKQPRQLPFAGAEARWKKGERSRNLGVREKKGKSRAM